ncbi:MAG: hypothetical protein UT34_C0001G0112 [candidate division WS6 bacterium GW2011_GWF2_39_15]|uniref:Uncharacterized protein n=1 Tax=candidate division WS6 bacterium GW2011_GWF2_39_15 TaxID=1619100 RepID=A0A0G0QWQ0_9BACT|nr:MAG: hypothetical protein UT34_C0001G0112 [candidate division WS6 bacterium GW2011_GWF2_39_15]
MKKLFLFLTLLLTWTFLIHSPVYAEVPETTGDYFNVELSLGTQSPWTKSVPINVKFRSNITADKVEISWDAPEGIEIIERHPQFIPVEKGEVYSYTAYAKPSTSGTYNISGNITDWEFKTNYTSSASITLTFDEDKTTVPQTAGYSGAVIIKSLILLLLALGGLFGLYLLARNFVKKLKKWLEPPE